MLTTETWLIPEEDDIKKRSTCLTMDNEFKIKYVDRNTSHRGGAPALISCSYLDLKLMDMKKMKTLEFALWKIKSGKVEFEFLGIYHPPSLQLHKHTNQKFVDEFHELFVDLSNKYLNMMIEGDLNIHIFTLKIKM